MNLEYAIDRLYDTGWVPDVQSDLERAADGRWFPTLRAVEAEFAAAGLVLSVHHAMMFNCFRAAWCARGGSSELGTVVGSTEQEAAVFALAQLRLAKLEQQLAST